MPADERHQLAAEPEPAQILFERDITEDGDVAGLTVHPVSTEDQGGHADGEPVVIADPEHLGRGNAGELGVPPVEPSPRLCNGSVRIEELENFVLEAFVTRYAELKSWSWYVPRPTQGGSLY